MNVHQSQLDQFLRELREVEEGVRGFAICSKSRAKKLGVPATALAHYALERGLRVFAHGKYGLCADLVR